MVRAMRPERELKRRIFLAMCENVFDVSGRMHWKYMETATLTKIMSMQLLNVVSKEKYKNYKNNVTNLSILDYTDFIQYPVYLRHQLHYCINQSRHLRSSHYFQLTPYISRQYAHEKCTFLPRIDNLETVFRTIHPFQSIAISPQFNYALELASSEY